MTVVKQNQIIRQLTTRLGHAMDLLENYDPQAARIVKDSNNQIMTEALLFVLDNTEPTPQPEAVVTPEATKKPEPDFMENLANLADFISPLADFLNKLKGRK